MSNGCTSVGKYDPATGHMSFELALDAMKRGRKVTRNADGRYKKAWFELQEGQLYWRSEIARMKAKIDTEELMAEDWIEVL